MLSLSGQSPAEGEKRADIESLIEFSIIDDGSGIDLNSLIVEVSGARAIEGSTFKDGYDGTFSGNFTKGDGVFTRSGNHRSVSIPNKNRGLQGPC